MSRSAAEQRYQQILDAALRCFERYGYRRTSMETIARTAGVSRPALYQHFRGKDDVFRALGAQMLDAAIDEAGRVARSSVPVADRLYGVLRVKLDLVAGATSAEYRGELIAEAERLAPDVFESFRRRLLALVEQVLRSGGELDFAAAGMSARGAAVLVLDAANGVERADAPPRTQLKRLRHLTELTVRGLSR
jgi:TetR/AcrR family transcriptional regulator